MADEVSTVTELKTTSDGTVKLSIEKYNELLSRPAISISHYDDLRRRANNPPVINRTQVIKTQEILEQELRAWGVSLMGLGAGIFSVGVYLFKKSFS